MLVKQLYINLLLYYLYITTKKIMQNPKDRKCFIKQKEKSKANEKTVHRKIHEIFHLWSYGERKVNLV